MEMSKHEAKSAGLEAKLVCLQVPKSGDRSSPVEKKRSFDAIRRKSWEGLPHAQWAQERGILEAKLEAALSELEAERQLRASAQAEMRRMDASIQEMRKLSGNQLEFAEMIQSGRLSTERRRSRINLSKSGDFQMGDAGLSPAGRKGPSVPEDHDVRPLHLEENAKAERFTLTVEDGEETRRELDVLKERVKAECKKVKLLEDALHDAHEHIYELETAQGASRTAMTEAEALLQEISREKDEDDRAHALKNVAALEGQLLEERKIRSELQNTLEVAVAGKERIQEEVLPSQTEVIVEALSEQLEVAHSRAEELENMLHEANRTVEALGTNVTNLLAESEAARLKAEQSAVDKTTLETKLQESVQERERHIAEARVTEENLQKRMAVVVEALDEQGSEVLRLKRELVEMEAQKHALFQEVAKAMQDQRLGADMPSEENPDAVEASDEMRTLQEYFSRLIKHIEELDSAKESREMEIRQLQVTVTSLKSDCQKLESLARGGEDLLVQFEAVKEEAKQAESFRHDLAQSLSKIEQLLSESTGLQLQLDASREAESILVTEVESLRKCKMELEERCRQMETETLLWESKQLELESSVKTLQEEVGMTEERIQMMTEQVESERQNAEHLVLELREATTKKGEYLKKLREAESSEKQLESQLVLVEGEWEEALARAEAAEKKLSEKRRHIKLLKVELARLTSTPGLALLDGGAVAQSTPREPILFPGAVSTATSPIRMTPLQGGSDFPEASPLERHADTSPDSSFYEEMSSPVSPEHLSSLCRMGSPDDRFGSPVESNDPDVDVEASLEPNTISGIAGMSVTEGEDGSPSFGGSESLRTSYEYRKDQDSAESLCQGAKDDSDCQQNVLADDFSFAVKPGSAEKQAHADAWFGRVAEEKENHGPTSVLRSERETPKLQRRHVPSPEVGRLSLISHRCVTPQAGSVLFKENYSDVRGSRIEAVAGLFTDASNITSMPLQTPRPEYMHQKAKDEAVEIEDGNDGINDCIMLTDGPRGRGQARWAADWLGGYIPMLPAAIIAALRSGDAEQVVKHLRRSSSSILQTLQGSSAEDLRILGQILCVEPTQQGADIAAPGGELSRAKQVIVWFCLRTICGALQGSGFPEPTGEDFLKLEQVLNAETIREASVLASAKKPDGRYPLSSRKALLMSDTKAVSKVMGRLFIEPNAEPSAEEEEINIKIPSVTEAIVKIEEVLRTSVDGSLLGEGLEPRPPVKVKRKLLASLPIPTSPSSPDTDAAPRRRFASMVAN